DEAAAAPPDVALTRPEGLAAGVARLLPHVDWDWGGLGRAPKFPSASTLELFLNMSRRACQFAGGDAPPARAAAMLRLTLEKMWRGGVYDHLRGGFARYSVDRYWRVPHFEKMLYDNAQLLPLYAEASALWQDDAWLWPVARDTLEYLRVEMRDPGGAFYAATDADSEGEEGKYFAWTPAQIAEVLQDDELTRLAVHTYGVTRAGSFEHGRSVL
ncbi:MAG: thioredoxin domain-containing protein, partial [Bdellovibrionales bacterium]|nr:thioredoxin domain-containing protein [Bdellovibrionales bacterium]